MNRTDRHLLAACLLGTILAAAPTSASDRRPPDECGDPAKVSQSYRYLPGTVIEVIDGDTLVVDLHKLNFDEEDAFDRLVEPALGKTTVQLVNIEAPAAPDPWADEAREHLSSTLLGKAIEVMISPHQEPGAPMNVMIELRDGHDLDEGVALLELGLARYRDFGPYALDWWLECKYQRAEERAREAKHGLWGDM